MNAKLTTWLERLADEEAAPLAGAFIESIEQTAAANERTPEDVWQLWQAYVARCEDYDQSPVFREFCNWNKLVGAGPLA